MNIFKNSLFFLLFILSFISVQLLFDKELVINANAGFDIRTQSDSYELGGSSISDLKIVDNKMILNCEIKNSDYQWPFCNITFKFYDDTNFIISDGIDLSNYEYLQVDARYVGHDDLGIKIQLRSFDEAYAVKEKTETWKFIGLEYWPEPDTSVAKIPVNALQVPNWWIIHNKVPLAHSGPDYNNVMVLELATASGIAEGSYQIEVKEIKLVGRYLSKQTTYGIIVILVIFSLIYTLLTELIEKNRLKNNLTNIVGTNKQLHQKNESLSKLINIDELTKTLNRRACQDIFNLKFERLCVIFMDIDYFKQINDSFGHDVGDTVLQQFATLINLNIRDRDFFVRWGGEEFVLISPDFNIDEAQEVSFKIKRLISQYQWPHNIKLSCSFGVAERLNDESAESVISRADKALYVAKRNGRDQVVIAEGNASQQTNVGK